MTQTTPRLEYWFGRVVRVNVDTTKPGGEEDFRTVEGKVTAATTVGLVIKARGGPLIIEAHRIIGEIEEIKRPPRRRVIVRRVREIGVEDSVRQHLADRHGILVSVLNAVDDETARSMHGKIRHDDLGHAHDIKAGDGPNLEALEDAGDDE